MTNHCHSLRLLGTSFVALALLSGCTDLDKPLEFEPTAEGFINHTFNTGTWNQLPEPMAPHIEEIAQDLRLEFASGSDQLSQNSRVALHSFLRDRSVSAQDRLELDGPRSVSGGLSNLSSARLATIQAELAAVGLAASISPTNPATSIKEDQVALSVVRSVVITPDCERPQPLEASLPNIAYSCSTAVNLGHMVAHPEDLKGSDPLSPADGASRTGSIVRYRTDAVKKIEIVDTK